MMLARYGALLETAARPPGPHGSTEPPGRTGGRLCSLMRDRTATLNRLKTLTIGLLQRYAPSSAADRGADHITRCGD
ncbi:hypothetical protein A0U90_06925 [Kozakia baliensis]|nr:hypothetical protein A0U90_06925 [Kozakia baliensis]